jgi:hypothetical protein
MDLFQKQGFPVVKAPAIRWIGQTAVAGYPDILAKLPVDGLTALETKTGDDPPLTDNQI